MGSISMICPVCGGKTETIKDKNTKYPGYFLRRCISDDYPECNHVGLYERVRDERQRDVDFMIASSEQTDPFTKVLYCTPSKPMRYYYAFVKTISPSGMAPLHDVKHAMLKTVIL